MIYTWAVDHDKQVWNTYQIMICHVTRIQGTIFFLKSHVICLPFVRLSSFPVSGYTVLCVLCTTKLWCSYVMETKEERLVVYLSVCLSVSLSVNLSTAVYS